MVRKSVSIVFVIFALLLAACASSPNPPGSTNTNTGLDNFNSNLNTNTSTGNLNSNLNSNLNTNTSTGNLNSNLNSNLNTNTSAGNLNSNLNSNLNTNTSTGNLNSNLNTNSSTGNLNSNTNSSVTATPAVPAGTGLTGPINTYADLATALTHAGETVSVMGEVQTIQLMSGLPSGRAQSVNLREGQIQVVEFDDTATAQTVISALRTGTIQAATLFPGVDTTQPLNVWGHNQIIVLYWGTNPGIISHLTTLLGAPIVGGMTPGTGVTNSNMNTNSSTGNVNTNMNTNSSTGNLNSNMNSNYNSNTNSAP